MSVHVTSWVLRHSEAKLGERLVLLVLADHAEHDGTNAWPSITTIAMMTRLSERQVQRCLRSMEERGEIVREGRHRTPGQNHGTYSYAVNMKGDNLSPLAEAKGDIQGTPRVTSMSPELSLEPTEEPNGSSAQKLTSTFVDRSRARGADPPSRVIGQVARETKMLVADGIPEARILAAYDLMLERALHPSALASCVQQVCLNGGRGKAKSALPAVERARAWVQNVGWQYPDAALAEELGRFDLNAGQKRSLIALAISMQGGVGVVHPDPYS